MKIAILGAGAWGSALAIALCARHDVTLWSRDRGLADAITAARRNARYLPEAAFPDRVSFTADLGAALSGGELALVATPTAGLRAVLESVRAAGFAGAVVWACKGFEQASAKLPHEIAADV